MGALSGQSPSPSPSPPSPPPSPSGGGRTGQPDGAMRIRSSPARTLEAEAIARRLEYESFDFADLVARRAITDRIATPVRCRGNAMAATGLAGAAGLRGLIQDIIVFG